jgi:hypothetical protein
LTAYRGNNLLDFAVDPRDWRRVNVVDAGNYFWATFNSRNSRTRLWTAGPISQISRWRHHPDEGSDSGEDWGRDPYPFARAP